MIKFEKADEIEKKLKTFSSNIENLISSKDIDLTQEVKNQMHPESAPLSENRTDALAEAVYRGEILGETENASKAESEATDSEIKMIEEAIIDKYVRDFLGEALFKGI